MWFSEFRCFYYQSFIALFRFSASLGAMETGCVCASGAVLEIQFELDKFPVVTMGWRRGCIYSQNGDTDVCHPLFGASLACWSDDAVESTNGDMQFATHLKNPCEPLHAVCFNQEAAVSLPPESPEPDRATWLDRTTRPDRTTSLVGCTLTGRRFTTSPIFREVYFCTDVAQAAHFVHIPRNWDTVSGKTHDWHKQNFSSPCRQGAAEESQKRVPALFQKKTWATLWALDCLLS